MCKTAEATMKIIKSKRPTRKYATRDCLRERPPDLPASIWGTGSCEILCCGGGGLAISCGLVNDAFCSPTRSRVAVSGGGAGLTRSSRGGDRYRRFSQFAIRRALRRLMSAFVVVKKLSLPTWDALLPAWRILCSNPISVPPILTPLVRSRPIRYAISPLPS
jgi:hypothetical protein